MKELIKRLFSTTLKSNIQFLRGLEIIWEATKNLSGELKKKYQNIPWREIAGMRGKLIHQYFGVDIEIPWKTVREDIPLLNNRFKIF